MEIEVTKGRTYFSLHWRDKEQPTHVTDLDNASVLKAFKDIVSALEENVG